MATSGIVVQLRLPDDLGEWYNDLKDGTKTKTIIEILRAHVAKSD